MQGAWRDIVDQTSYTPERFTPAVYQQVMAGKPRMAGARAALEHFGVPDVDRRVEQYAAAKQQQILRLIEEGRFVAFPDALRFILAVKAMGIRVAAASSSKNAKLFLERIRLDTFAAEQRLDYDFIRPGMTLEELFDADTSGRDFPRGKPDPMIFLTAAAELGVRPGAYFVTRGALPEARADGVNYPGTYLAGLYNRLVTEIAGRRVQNEDLVNVPNWLVLQFRVAGGAWFDVGQADVLEHRFELDLRHGTLIRHLAWRDDQGRRTSMVQRRFVSMKDEHLAGLETTFTAENWSGTLEVRSGLDGRVVNAGVKRYRDLNGRHLAVLGQAEVDSETVDLQVETTQSHVRVALAARTRLLRDELTIQADRRLVTEPGFVALSTSRDRATSESRADARLLVAGAEDFEQLLTRHQTAWDSLWNRFDIQLDSANEWTETVLHLHIFHLLQTISPHTLRLDVGVPARGWHGEAYRGHIFWDEMFIFPFFNFQRPILASALLEYRHARLGRPGQRPGQPGSPARCSRGRAAPMGRRRRSNCTSTRNQGAGCPTAPTGSGTSTSRSPTTSGSTTWSPGAPRSCAFPVASC